MNAMFLKKNPFLLLGYVLLPYMLSSILFSQGQIVMMESLSLNVLKLRRKERNWQVALATGLPLSGRVLEVRAAGVLPSPRG
jgi:hypothetical protein